MLHQIKHIAAETLAEVIEFRRHLHMNPELSYHEEKTAAFVKEKLDSWGISCKTNVGGFGIVALIEGKNQTKKVIALRADMDALPILEENKTEYVSKVPGVMHACGHDVHTASLLGAAKILQQLKTEFEGTIKLIFQPAEEKLPGGASLMIKDGVLENPKPFGIIGQHVMPLIDAGKIGVRSGMYMASADEIEMTVYGKGGHAAMPHLNVDTVLITSHIIVALQQIVSRNANPTIPSVLSFGKINSEGGAYNIIPNTIHVLGTFRTMDEKWRDDAHLKMKKMAETLAESMGGRCDFIINKGYPALINNEELSAEVRTNAVEYVGEENVIDLDMWMAAEDFAYYSQITRACFYRLGTRNEAKGITSSVHTPTFDIDESALEIGMGLMAYNAIKSLK